MSHSTSKSLTQNKSAFSAPVSELFKIAKGAGGNWEEEWGERDEGDEEGSRKK